MDKICTRAKDKPRAKTNSHTPQHTPFWKSRDYGCHGSDIYKQHSNMYSIQYPAKWCIFYTISTVVASVCTDTDQYQISMP